RAQRGGRRGPPPGAGGRGRGGAARGRREPGGRRGRRRRRCGGRGRRSRRRHARLRRLQARDGRGVRAACATRGRGPGAWRRAGQPFSVCGGRVMDGARAPIKIHLVVNGRPSDLEIAPHALLLDVLRDVLDLKGAKGSWDTQVGGGGPALAGGWGVSACTYLALEADGRAVLTVEGLAEGDSLHPLQRAF